MKKKICPLEKEVMAGLRAEKLEPKLQKHLSECPVCQDVVTVQAWMNQFKEKAWKADVPKKSLPDADDVWNRAYALKRPDKRMVRKALRPLIYPQVLSFGIFIAGIIFLGIKGVLKFGNIFDTPALTRALPFFLLFLSIIIISVVFCALLLALEKRKKPI
ncbi:MAG: hypothetical protein JSV46_10910 [Candidatus Aminicenantes bacterium]|nr:MAG: hypothetical protein JSV46_10910 [Candidatus Aminicenantes bacterium]